MIVVDTSVWIEFFRSGTEAVKATVSRRRDAIVVHDLVIGELALGNFRDRSRPFRVLNKFRKMPLATTAEVLAFIESERLHGTGIGYVDAHLLASAAVTAGAEIWTHDRRLAAVAHRLGLLADLSGEFGQ